MAIMEQQALDMSTILLQAYELSDLIERSKEMADYLYWKQRVDEDEEVKEAVRHLDSKKILFEECQRFGHFHPDYHAALEEAKQAQEQLDAIETVQQFKRAEEALDDLLYTVSKTIAHAVSESIKVPSNSLQDDGGGCGSGGCGSGGSCSGNCG